VKYKRKFQNTRKAQKPNGQSNNLIAMAYMVAYLLQQKETLYLCSIHVPKWGPVSSLQFYNDYGYLEKIKL
jgi:hypothetical protein